MNTFCSNTSYCISSNASKDSADECARHCTCFNDLIADNRYFSLVQSALRLYNLTTLTYIPVPTYVHSSRGLLIAAAFAQTESFSSICNSSFKLSIELLLNPVLSSILPDICDKSSNISWAVGSMDSISSKQSILEMALAVSLGLFVWTVNFMVGSMGVVAIDALFVGCWYRCSSKEMRLNILWQYEVKMEKRTGVYVLLWVLMLSAMMAKGKSLCCFGLELTATQWVNCETQDVSVDCMLSNTTHDD